MAYLNPQQGLRVWWAPAGADPQDRSQWREVNGFAADDGVVLGRAVSEEVIAEALAEENIARMPDTWNLANPRVGSEISAEDVDRMVAEADRMVAMVGELAQRDLMPWQREVLQREMLARALAAPPMRPVLILAANHGEAELVARLWQLPRGRWSQLADGRSPDRLRGTRGALVIATACWRDHLPWTVVRGIEHSLARTEAEVIYVDCP